MEQMRRNMSDYVWTTIPSLDALRHTRLRAIQTFLSDYDRGKAQRRYIDAELPTLPFDTASFDLAVCSHLLFLYSMQLTNDFHRAAELSSRTFCTFAREFSPSTAKANHRQL